MTRTILLRLVYTLLSLSSAIECFLLPLHTRRTGRSTQHCGNNAVVVRRLDSPLIEICSCGKIATASSLTVLKAVEKDESTTKSSLTSLGYTDEEIQLSRNREMRQQKGEKLNVQVNLLPDIDSVTLTAVGFALIAFNFFVLGNLEDGGIAGVVATIINTLSQ